jgi:hypothetical protein
MANVKGVKAWKRRAATNRKGNFAFIFMSFEIRRRLNEAKVIDRNKFPKRHSSADHDETSYPSHDFRGKGHEIRKIPNLILWHETLVEISEWLPSAWDAHDSKLTGIRLRYSGERRNERGISWDRLWNVIAFDPSRCLLYHLERNSTA